MERSLHYSSWYNVPLPFPRTQCNPHLLLLASATSHPALIPVREVLAFPNSFRCGLEGGQRRKTTAQPLNSISFLQTTGDLQNMVGETLL